MTHTYETEDDLEQATDRRNAVRQAQDDAEDAIMILETARDALKRHGCDAGNVGKALEVFAATLRSELTAASDEADKALRDARAAMARIWADEAQGAEADYLHAALGARTSVFTQPCGGGGREVPRNCG